jgi:diacylglycerol kinase family enzyme
LTHRTLIVNPNASRVTELQIADVEARLQPVETLRTEGRGHAMELARRAVGEEVWALGGDGVVNEVLNGLRSGATLGIVPAGGTNVLARGLGARERRISVGRVNGRRFAFAAGIGVDSEVVRELDADRGGRRASDVRYARAVAGKLLRGYEPRLEVVGMGRAAILFVSNNAVFTYAGPLALRFSPRARYELGLDVAAPRRVTALSSATLVGRVLAGKGVAGSNVLAGHDLDRV